MTTTLTIEELDASLSTTAFACLGCIPGVCYAPEELDESPADMMAIGCRMCNCSVHTDDE